MCKYVGGKKRIAHELYKAMTDFEHRLYGDTKLPYFEPFVGMFSIVKEFDDGRERVVCDLNPDIVELWRSVLSGWYPPKRSITHKYYQELKHSQVVSAERGFYGTACAFGGAFFTGFSGNAGGNIKRLIHSAYNNIKKYAVRLHGVVILDADTYQSFKPRGCLIYCDPPYVRTIKKTNLKYLDTFNPVVFWKVMRKWSKHNLVFISEETAPSDFISIWNKNIRRVVGISRTNGVSKSHDDRLFVHRQYIV